MMQFTTYKLGSHTKGGWFWQVTKDMGPVTFVVARSGMGYNTEQGAIAAYKEFVKWATGDSTAPPPTT